MRRFAALLFCCLFWVSGCARAPRVAGVLHLAQEGDASTLDPARAYDTTSIQFVRLLYRGLVDYNTKAEIVNEIAQSRSVSNDGKTYSFTLRKGVKFHDGTPVIAADFRYALERVLDPETASGGLSLYTMIAGAKEWSKDRAGPQKMKHISGIEVRGKDRIIFHLVRPDATFLNYLTLPFAYAVPQSWVEKLGKEGKSLSENPNGCGPFKLAQWVHNGWLYLDKNPDYFRPELPKSKRIEVQFGISPSLQIMLFEQGAIDILPISEVFAPDYLRLTRDSKWKNEVLHAPMMDVRYLALNNEIKPFNDVRVRRAMNYAINRDRIVSFLTGRATKARGALPPGIPGFNPQLQQYAFDPKKARQLLREAGYKDTPNAPIPLIYPTGDAGWYPKAAQSIQQDLKEVGISVSLQGMTYGELKARAGQRGKSPLGLMGWVQDFPDPANFLDVLFNQKSISDTSSVNRAFYSNPKVNALLDRAGIETKRAKRLALYQDAEKLIVADAPWVFLHHTERYVVRQPWVKGFRLHPMWSATYENVAVD
ncbi:peptide/nickel transport system substrate-binding protein [Abditibacterium utsteinense]|uniref:Peptide/nickel transport system substrate-binding protein n=1 Tax=Abditibacterium utsteinense TaxID=1960156 RepID=A0A2S8SV40_9BACT|nr:ABC transporter substrate-binding protein [Abditibacterium utsteinense]PQV64665.1 peptide/nickel transport system substrate-binding protein [Abditibacterium utsteinense]